MPISYDSSSLLKCTVSFSYLRYVINEVIKKPSTTPGTIGDTKSAKPGSKQTPAQNKENNNYSANDVDLSGWPGTPGNPNAPIITPQQRRAQRVARLGEARVAQLEAEDAAARRAGAE